MRYIHSATEPTQFQQNLYDHLSTSAYEAYTYIQSADIPGAGSFDCVIMNTGILFLQYLPIKDKAHIQTFLDRKDTLMNSQAKQLYEKLCSHRGLTFQENEQIRLAVPMALYYVFPELSSEEHVQGCVYNNQIERILAFDVALFPYSKNFAGITEQDAQLITFVLAPEYTSTIAGDNRFSVVADGQANAAEHPLYQIKPGDIYANAFSLDDEQIDIVNRITEGHWLIESPAGSGKSVLLLSTAIRYAKTYSDENILIVCRNRNLANVYTWKLSQSGVRQRKINCFNVYRLCQHILALGNVRFSPKDFDANYEKALRLLESGKVALPYHAIFIDEIQILREKYYKLFGFLIAKARLVCLYGDVEQDANVNLLGSKQYPWEITRNLHVGDNVIRLTKNYRNTVNIALYANGFLELIKFYYNRLGIQPNVLDENYTSGTAFKPGVDPVLLGGPLEKEAAHAADLVQSLSEQKTPLSEIAILFPQRKNAQMHYAVLDCLKEQLEQRGIPYTELIHSADSLAGSIGQSQGVILSTIDAVLGLDFKNVILCGLSCLGVYHGSNRIELDSIGLSVDCMEDFYRCCNLLYIAITRAREGLHILLTENSIYTKLLRQALSLKQRKEGMVQNAEP